MAQLNRVAVEDLEIQGVPIAAGENIVVTLAAANRDPDAFAEPDRLELARRPNRHTSLAFGPHFCLGASLARLEGRIAFTELARRFPRMELAAETLPHRDNIVLRGVRELALALGAPA